MSTAPTGGSIPSSTLKSSPSSSRTGSSTALALGVSLAVVASLIVGGLAFYFVRRHRNQRRVRERNAEMSSHRRTYMVSVDPTHLAARVTPFGVNAPEVQVPKFVHTPGENMRIAHRRSDGGWEFREGVRGSQSVDLQLQRDPTLPTMDSRPCQSTKEKKLRPGELTTRGYVESDFDGNAPPAYTQDHDTSVFSDNTGV